MVELSVWLAQLVEDSSIVLEAGGHWFEPCMFFLIITLMLSNINKPMGLVFMHLSMVSQKVCVCVCVGGGGGGGGGGRGGEGRLRGGG